MMPLRSETSPLEHLPLKPILVSLPSLRFKFLGLTNTGAKAFKRKRKLFFLPTPTANNGGKNPFYG